MTADHAPDQPGTAGPAVPTGRPADHLAGHPAGHSAGRTGPGSTDGSEGARRAGGHVYLHLPSPPTPNQQAPHQPMLEEPMRDEPTAGRTSSAPFRSAQGAGGADGPASADPVEQLARWLRAAVRYRMGATSSLGLSAPPGRGSGMPAGADRREWGRAVIAAALEEQAQQALRAGRPPANPIIEREAANRVWNEMFGLGALEELLADPDIENIHCNGCDNVHVRRADGSRQQVAPVASSDAELVELVRTVIARSGAEERRLDRASPAVSAELPDGSRLFAVTLARRVSVSIRRHRHRDVTLADLERLGTITRPLRGLLAAAVRARFNIVISGGTAAGKTTLLRALASEISPSERLVTVEDTFELNLDQAAAHPDTVALQAREPNLEGRGGITLAEVTRWALRMAPDRVIVGEVRGREAAPMIQAMSQGNDGSLSTIHSSSSSTAFLRLAACLLEAEQIAHLNLPEVNLLIAGAVHLVVHISARPDGTRTVTSIREVVDADGPRIVSNEIIRPGRDGRAAPGAPIRSATVAALAAAGYDTTSLREDPS